MVGSPQRLEGIELVAFDLDNTLYDEGAYFARALDTIAPEIARRSGGDGGRIRLRFDEILQREGKHYHHLFDDVLGEEGLAKEEHLEDLLGLFSKVEGKVELFAGVRELIAALRPHFRLGLITSGRKAVQVNKLRLLELAATFDAVVFSSTLAENKPARLPFQTLCDELGVAPEHSVYIGDNPLFDFKGSGELGMTTIRVDNREFDTHVCAAGWDARIRVASVTDIGPLLLPVEEKPVVSS
ncbi:MAG: HAD family hydrolase [Deltaproteobacteria bacterium]